MAPSVRFNVRPIAFAPCLPARERIVFTSAAVQGFGFFLRVRGILTSKCGSGILGRSLRQIVEKAAGAGRRPMPHSLSAQATGGSRLDRIVGERLARREVKISLDLEAHWAAQAFETPRGSRTRAPGIPEEKTRFAF